MRVYVTTTGPNKLSVMIKKREVVIYLDPGIAGLAEHAARLAGCSVNKVEIKLVLRTIHNLGPDQTVAHPTKVRNVDVFVAGQVKPTRLAAVAVHHAQAHFRIWVAHLGILLVVDRWVLRNEIGNRICRNTGLVHLQQDHLLSVVRPEVVAAYAQFFGVHPIHFAVQDIGAMIVREFVFVATGNVADIKIVVADVTQLASVGRKFWIVQWIARRVQMHCRTGRDGIEPQLAKAIEENVFRIRRPTIGRDPVALAVIALAIIFAGREWRRPMPQLVRCDHYRRFPGSQVNVVELGFISLIIAQDVSDLLAVRTPLHGFRSAASDAAFGKDRWDSKFRRLLAKANRSQKKDP